MSLLRRSVDTILTNSNQVAFQAKAVVHSRAYLYPPLGALYLVEHHTLWPTLLRRIFPCLILSVSVIIPMFILTYVPQAAVLTFTEGLLGPLSAIALVLSESSVIINVLSRTFLLEQALNDIFDATLICEGQVSLVSKGREIRPGKNSDGVKKLGRLLKKPLQTFSPSTIMQYIFMLPLNLIPVVGTVVFLVLQGQKIGPIYHTRYFQLKGYIGSDREAFIRENRGSYIAFGTTVMIMNLVPLASILITFASTVGAALWASDIERRIQGPVPTFDIFEEDEARDKTRKAQ